MRVKPVGFFYFQASGRLGGSSRVMGRAFRHTRWFENRLSKIIYYIS